MIWGQIYAEQAKLYERLLSLLRGAIKLSFLPLRIALPRRRYSCALILLGALGLLAFALSAISPDDDDFQHECIHRRTSQRPLVQAKKDFLSSHIRFHVSAAESVAGQVFVDSEKQQPFPPSTDWFALVALTSKSVPIAHLPSRTDLLLKAVSN